MARVIFTKTKIEIFREQFEKQIDSWSRKGNREKKQNRGKHETRRDL